jgi:hypothetical protein
LSPTAGTGFRGFHLLPRWYCIGKGHESLGALVVPDDRPTGLMLSAHNVGVQQSQVVRSSAGWPRLLIDFLCNVVDRVTVKYSSEDYDVVLT